MVEAFVPRGAAMPAAAAMPERRKVEFTVETCASGLTLCRGTLRPSAPPIWPCC